MPEQSTVANVVDNDSWTSDADFDVLKLLWRVRQPGCPCCRAAHEAETASIRWFYLENYNDVATLRTLMRKRFCAMHLTELIARAEPKLSVTLEFLTRVEAGRLRAYNAALARASRRRCSFGRRRSSLPDGAQPAEVLASCPLCQAQRTAAVVAMSEVLFVLTDERGRRAYQQSDGLCRPHGWQAIDEAPLKVAAWLGMDLQRRLDAAHIEFERYYEFLTGADPDYARRRPWMRAAQLLWGDGRDAGNA